ncbi:MAG: DUF2961 domain-containing protein [Hyphomonadaceae bacterium]|nr:DUF2961 domain-containing protein [Hyphomonadaceae bacterium]
MIERSRARWFAFAAAVLLCGCAATSSDTTALPIVPGVQSLFLLSGAQSRSISPENLTGAKGMGGRTTLENGSAKAAAQNLGLGWKVNPYVQIAPGSTFVMGETDGPGIINHIWMTLGGTAEYRSAILRIYWDGETTPSVEAPVGDFFASGWGKGNEPLIDSSVVAVNPGSGFNSYWQMPFRKKFRMTMENRSAKPLTIYYQIDYSLQAVPANAAYFHAQFRMVDRLKAKNVYTILDGVKGEGHYVGTYLGHGAFSPGWWGEGEIKFYLDGDTDFPTINGTGEEDYFLGSYIYVKRDAKGVPHEINYSTAYAGFYAVKPVDWATEYFKPDFERRNGQYRWHIMDPVRFGEDLKVTIQSIGWDGATNEKILGNGTYLPLEDYLASVAFWYQAEPHAPFPALPVDQAMQLAPPKGQ